ncbi:peptide ABC transporter substrate-binding protein [Pseudomonas putida]|nr:peptide ABC transporter substrate-binding protein [Pseudomonas putida]
MRLTTLCSTLLALGLLSQAPLSFANNLVFCSEGSPAGFDTAQYTAATDNDAAEPIYNRLVEFERGGTAVQPGLATDWQVSDDGLKYTFHLRPGVKFHANKDFKPSRDFNADDVLFTFNRMLDKSHPFRQAYPPSSRTSSAWAWTRTSPRSRRPTR